MTPPIFPFGFLAPADSEGPVDPPDPGATSWQTDARDYFLTSNWVTNTGDNSTGYVTAWDGEKATMNCTVWAPTINTVQTGAGAGRRAVYPRGGLACTNFPASGEVGICFAFQRTINDYMRFLSVAGSFYSPGFFTLLENSYQIGYDPGGGNAGTTTAVMSGHEYEWHCLGIKYNRSAASVPKLFLDGIALTGSIGAQSPGALVEWGNRGSFDRWNLGDFAYYEAPTDAKMQEYTAAIAAKWRA